jgi:adenylate cyclase
VNSPVSDQQPPGATELEALLLGAKPTHSRDDVARMTGLDVHTARRLWRALGFADIGHEPVFTDNDVAVVREMVALLRTGALDERTLVQMVRAFGRTTSRLADWQIDSLTRGVERFEAEGGGFGDPAQSAYKYAAELLPVFQDMLIVAWRRHLARAASRMLEQLSLDQEARPHRVMSVGFADLVAFTQLLQGLSDDAVAGIVDEFEARATDVIAKAGGSVVKALGDEVMYVAGSPIVAVDIGLELVEVVGVYPGLPDIRVGIATGPVLTRFGDVFGHTVNLASRLMALAAQNGVVVDGETAAALIDGSGFVLETQPPQPLRGIGEVVAVAVSRVPSAP